MITALPRSDWHLDILDNALAWDGVSLEDAAREWGTPAYLVSASELRDASSRWMKLAGDWRSHYSIKTCPVQGMLRRLGEAGFCAECVSGHEIRLAIEAGFPPRDILFGGTARTGEELARALREGVGMFIVDSIEELTLLETLAAHPPGDSETAVMLRVRAGVDPRGTARVNKTGVRAQHLGFDPAAEEFRRALAICKSSQGLRLAGLHSHIGTGLRDLRSFTRNLGALAALRADLRREGHEIGALNLGGGVAVPTVREFTPIEFLRHAAFGHMPRARHGRGDLLESYFSALRTAYSEAFPNAADRPDIVLEPGRAVTSGAALLLVRVAHIRERRGGATAVIDGGALSTGMPVLGEYHEVFPVRAPNRARTRRYTLAGKIPTPLDLLYRNKPMPELRAGDLLAVMDAGAYMIPTATNFATLRAPVVLLVNGAMRLLRRRETADDLLAREQPDA